MIEHILTEKELDMVVGSDIPTISVYYKDSCPLCKVYINKLKKYDCYFYLLNVTEHPDLFRKYRMSMFLPETRLYKNGDLLYIQSGVLYKKQLNEVFNLIKENTDG